MADAKLSEVAKYFRKSGQTLTDFAKEWKELPEKDQQHIRSGIGDGTLTY